MPIPAALIGAIPGIMGLIGNAIDRPRQQREERFASNQIRNLSDIFRSQLNQDYFDSEEGLSALRQIEDESSDNLRDINATANVNGLTDEARIALMGRNMRAKQGALAGLAGQSSLWRQRTIQNYGGSLQNLFNVGMANRRNAQNSINNIVGGVGGAIDGAFNTGAFDNLLSKGTATAPMVGGAASSMAGAFNFLKG